MTWEYRRDCFNSGGGVGFFWGSNGS